MALYSAISCICFGVLGFIWYDFDEADHIIDRGMTLYCSIYSFAIGFIMLAYEWKWGKKRGPSPIPTRGIVYLLASFFLFLSWPTLLAAFFVFSTSVANFTATALGEVYDAPPARAGKKTVSDREAKAEGWVGSVKVTLAGVAQQNKQGQWAFFFIYLAGNVVLMAWTWHIWVDKVDAARLAAGDDKNLVPTGWTPVAKAMGALLDLNCALILMPVLRTFIRYLYNRSTADQSCVANVLRAILYVVPLDKNLKLHKLIAGVIMGATILHTVAHYINFALRPAPVLTLFNGAWPLISGGVVCWAMFFIYTAAFENTKRGQFEIFWSE